MFIKAGDYDFFNITMNNAVQNFIDIPEPLPWIEPSINMLHLEVITSYIFGSYISAIISQGVLLEHILRMAVIDPVNSGVDRKITKNQIDQFRSIGAIIKNAEMPELLRLMDHQEANLDWWREIGRVLRNILPRFYIFIIKYLKATGGSGRPATRMM